MKNVIKDLIEAAWTVERHFTPGMGWYSGPSDTDGSPTYNHWSCALDQLQEALGRRLSDAEVSIFSVTLNYGPVPVLGEGNTSAFRHCSAGVILPRDAVGKIVSALDRDMKLVPVGRGPCGADPEWDIAPSDSIIEGCPMRYEYMDGEDIPMAFVRFADLEDARLRALERGDGDTANAISKLGWEIQEIQ